MDQKNNGRLSSSELASLWTQFMSDSMSICFVNHSLEYVKDKDVRNILEFALGLSQSHIDKITAFLKEDGYPVPKGFTKEDVNVNAPPLFSDSLLLVYMYVMTLHGLTGYAGSLGNSVRADQRSYFTQCNSETMELYDRILSVMLDKGIFSKPPNIPAPDGIDFVKSQSYLTGWFGKRRPLNATEITGLYFNNQKTIVKVVLEIAFSQVAQSKELRKYFQRGATLCKKQVKILNNILSEENLPVPKRWESEVSNSIVPPFSDKLMLYHVVILVSAAMGFYGAGLSVVQRRDLALQYGRLITDIGKYAEDGANLLIKHGWMEQPPMAPDRSALAKKNVND
ncbi:DUF3231 family protein [Halobacillus amylolyticus]|uniref:DUF3231 family protein n=1 Tax=Halobacillus amylolyticus TaxID=2932259 RepID=A0ABY4HEW7_9BACI|nr:DUF3231 family protein [Halobacillus amylolyticus]UOR13450.1 DUF3231 family protein [Halobacillus amylolyticus]